MAVIEQLVWYLVEGKNTTPCENVADSETSREFHIEMYNAGDDVAAVAKTDVGLRVVGAVEILTR